MDYDVVVAGAGPVGLMLACELRLAGVSVLVVERLTEPDLTIKAGSINVPTAEALYRRGLLPALQEQQQLMMQQFARMAGMSAPAPGSGPVAVKKILEPFLPIPVVALKNGGNYLFDYDRPQSIGKMKAFNGQFGMHVRALCYILANGPAGLKEVSETAVLNANYIRAKLTGAYELPYDSPTLHEVVFSDKLQARFDVHVADIGKRLMDYGFHPPTISFPLIVSGALMIEPTETESRQELDAFIDAMLAIAKEAEANPELVRSAPHTTRINRVNEAAAARKPVLRWTQT